MNVVCPGCNTVYRVDPAKVTSVALRARCSVCGGTIPVGERTHWEIDLATVPVTETRLAQGSPGAAHGSASDVVSGLALQAQGSLARPAVTPPRGPAVEERPAREPALATGPAGTAPAGQSAPAPLGQSAPGTPLSGEPRENETREQAPAARGPQMAISAAKPSMPPLASAFTTPSTPARSVSPLGTRRPVNPFLANDPHQRARRLARALVSDMVAYHPSRREEGLREGTLKELFAEEIKKSYEEYVEQVGRELAESTTYFKDALNEVLAGGRMIF
jgi:predicted Zn finger-like uncharacterized protein